MELSEFIKGVILDIRKGIESAKDGLGEDVLPPDFTDAEGVLHANKRTSSSSGTTSKKTILSNIEFEVSLIEGRKEEGSVGLGVFLGGFGLGTKNNSEDAKSSLSKIRFTIPIRLH